MEKELAMTRDIERSNFNTNKSLFLIEILIVRFTIQKVDSISLLFPIFRRKKLKQLKALNAMQL